MSENNTPFSPEQIAATLTQLPKDLFDSDSKIATLEAAEAELKESVQLAELNASLAAEFPEKSNAEIRKNLTDKAIAQSDEVKAARQALQAKRIELDVERATNKMQARQFAGVCHIAELKAAQMTLMSRGATR